MGIDLVTLLEGRVLVDADSSLPGGQKEQITGRIPAHLVGLKAKFDGGAEAEFPNVQKVDHILKIAQGHGISIRMTSNVHVLKLGGHAGGFLSWGVGRRFETKFRDCRKNS